MIRLKPFIGTLVHVLLSEGAETSVVEANSEGEEIILNLSITAPIARLVLVSPTGKKFAFGNRDLLDIVENSEDDGFPLGK